MKRKEGKQIGSKLGHTLMKVSVSLADLVLLNILFVLFSVPLLTIPASFAALNRIAYALVKDEPPGGKDENNAFPRANEFNGWKTLCSCFVKIIKAEFLRSLPLGLVLSIPAGFCMYILLAGKQIEYGIFIPTFVLLSLAVVFLLSCYIFTMLALLDIPVSEIIRNAVILLFENLPQNSLAVLIAAGLNLLMIAAFPFSFPLLLCIHFSLTAFLVQGRLSKGIDKCIQSE